MLYFSGIFQYFRQGNNVDRHSLLKQICHRLIDNTMSRIIKILVCNNISDLYHRVFIQKKSSQDALFCLNILRRQPQTRNCMIGFMIFYCRLIKFLLLFWHYIFKLLITDHCSFFRAFIALILVLGLLYFKYFRNCFLQIDFFSAWLTFTLIVRDYTADRMFGTSYIADNFFK